MKLFSGWRLGAVALAAAAAATLVATVPGAASAATSWRLAATFSKSGALEAASASGTSNEWVARNSSTSLLIEHRTASGWQQIPSPVISLAPTEIVSSVQVTAIPGGGAWVFADIALPHANGHVIAVQWTGSGWTAPQVFAEDAVTAVIALSPKDVWQFGPATTTSITIPTAAAWHYNGTTWSRYPVPWFVNAVSGSGSAGLWIIGRPSPSNARVSVAHWASNGWQLDPLPVTVHEGSFADGIVANGARDVWASTEWDPNFGPVVYGFLLHWNGSTWSRVALPSTTVRPRQLASDGHGGLWLVPDPRYVYHYSGGKWSALLKVPGQTGKTSQIRQLVAVPGSTSLLAAGDLYPPGGPADGAIFAYGP